MTGNLIDLSQFDRKKKDISSPFKEKWIDGELRFKMLLNKGKFIDGADMDTVKQISELSPRTEFIFDVPHVNQPIVAQHLNGSFQYNNAPLLSINSLSFERTKGKTALIQCFYGTNELQIKAVRIALLFMSLSNPTPAEWIFVEAQKREEDAKFKWVKELGARYVFRTIGKGQDYFIKEQLWNIGATKTNCSQLVFVDADVAYCQTNWLWLVDETFNRGFNLFQPHAWSWRASEPNGEKDEKVNSLNILESFGHRRKLEIPLTKLWGHTGYDIAITRNHYNAIHGFYSLLGTGGDFLMWGMLGKGKEELPDWYTFKNLIQKIEKSRKNPHENIGCSELTCFHNYHGSQRLQEKQYAANEEKMKTAKDPTKLVANNYGLEQIVEIGTWAMK